MSVGLRERKIGVLSTSNDHKVVRKARQIGDAFINLGPAGQATGENNEHSSETSEQHGRCCERTEGNGKRATAPPYVAKTWQL